MKHKGEKNIIVATTKFLIFLLLLLIQYFLIKYIYNQATILYIYSNWIFEAIKITSALYIVNKQDNPAYKISWLLLIMFFPIIGLILYFITGNIKLPKFIQNKVTKIIRRTHKLLTFNQTIEDEIKELDKRVYNSFTYLKNTCALPVYRNTSAKYFATGESYFESMLEDLKKAKKYILIEYFIISEGIIFNQIYKILEEKANQNVQVYILYDGIGSMINLPKQLRKKHKTNNIHIKAFNEISPIITTYINDRDHRKMTIIDGKIGYTGGINIGDEYANIEKKYGHWKDTGIKVEGNPVFTYVVMFLRLWELTTKEKLDYTFFETPTKELKKEDGFVMPYGDGPHNKFNPAENIYIDTLNKAKDYVYITSPYLVIDNEMLTALCNTALSGVDVRIMIPGIPDKKIVYIASKSYYPELLKAGVKIYEYTPGFLHSKTFISDDEISIVGSINLDYRSLYLHYELATYFYKSKINKQIKKDFEEMIKVSNEITNKNYKKPNLIIRVFEAVLRALSPMM